jgi:hypothetical protein
VWIIRNVCLSLNGTREAHRLLETFHDVLLHWKTQMQVKISTHRHTSRKYFRFSRIFSKSNVVECYIAVGWDQLDEGSSGNLDLERCMTMPTW